MTPAPHLVYLANARLPTEKAHGLQIVQNAEAFADAGARVSLWVPARFNSATLRRTDVYAHYGVARVFRLRRLPTLDLLPLVPGGTGPLARLIFALQSATFALSVLLGLLLVRPRIAYTRDAIALLAASAVLPRRALAFEVHQWPQGRVGRVVLRLALRRAGTVVAVTAPLLAALQGLAAPHTLARATVAHDGVRAARFAALPTQQAARAALGLPQGAFVVGYVGRLHTLGQDKGVGTLLDATARVPGAHLMLVGGPAEHAAAYAAQWRAHGLPPERFHDVGQRPPPEVPGALAACDVAVMPLPHTPHFAYHASPLKLFETLAAGVPLVATDLPAWADVLAHNVNALLVPPSDVAALAAALQQLATDPSLRARLGAQGRHDALAHHTWAARAARLLRLMLAPGD